MSAQSRKSPSHEVVSPDAARDASASWNLLPAGLLVAIAAVVAFAPSIRYGWVGWDDESYVTTSPLMSEPDGLSRIWASTEADQYYPLTFTLLRMEYNLWERDPTGYHATSVLLHAVNAILLLRVLRALGLCQAVSVATALLFAVHPMQAMSVAWVAQQKNLLSCAFVLLAILAWMRFRRGAGERWYVASLIAFAGALLSKTAVLTLPLGLIGVDLLILETRAASAVRRSLPMFAMAAVAMGITVVFEKPFVEDAILPNLVERVLIAGGAVWFYAVKLVCPVDLLPVYPLWDVSTVNILWWLPVILAVAAVLLLWRVRRRADRDFLLGLWLFLIFILPMLGLVPFGNLSATYVSEHYVYIACVGFFVALTSAVYRLFTHLRVGQVGKSGSLSLVVAALLFLTWRYEPVFRNAESMWTRTVEGNPACFMAHGALGQLRANENKWTAAIESYRRALELRPDHIPVRHAMARAQMQQEQFDDAEQTLLQVTQADDRLPGPVLDLAYIAERTGRYEEAVENYRRAVQLDPQHVEIRIRLARLYLGLSRMREAETQFAEAVRVGPGNPWGHLGLATCQRGDGRAADAIAVLERGLEAVPEDVALLNMLARVLASDPDEGVRNGPRAVRLAEQADRLAGGRDCLVLDTLAAAFAESGDFERAASTADRAAALADSLGYRQTAADIRRGVARYRDREPLREVQTKLVLR